MARQFARAAWFWRYLRQRPAAVGAMLAMGVASSLAEGFGIGLFIPLLQGLSDGAAPDGDSLLGRVLGGLFGAVPAEQRVTIILAAIFGAILLKAALTFGYGVLAEWLYVRFVYDIRTAAYRVLTTVGYRFFQRARSGSLLDTMETQTWRAGDAMAMLLNLLVTACIVLVYGALLLAISWQLTLVIAAAMLLFSQAASLMMKLAQRHSRSLTRSSAEVQGQAMRGLEGAKTIRIFGQEAFERERFAQASARLCDALFRIGRHTRAVEPLYEVLVVGLLIGILLFSLSRPEQLPSLVVFIVLLYRVQPKVKQFETLRMQLAATSASVDDVARLLDPDDKPVTVSGTLPFRGLARSLRLDGVTFRYDEGDAPALRDVSLRIAAGRTTALVGPSGSGKSTIIGLLLRLHDPSAGRITVDGVDLAQLDLAQWRSRIAVVSQDVYMFNASVRDNIAYGRPGASDSEIASAARLAHAHDFIMKLPDGYDTVVGERGARLSGGQQQRLSLARAILRDPDILILDEATNALDAISEQLIQEALDALSADRTVIVVAHRLSTIERAHHVAVVADGRIVEQGTVPQLVALGGLFAEMHQLQYRGAVA